jgi:tRNA A-37 threonylcarbamoyl transferase component Bud32
LLLKDIARAVLERAGHVGWTVKERGIWCQVEPPDARVPAQGWKLHMSATALSAPVVLARAAEVLVDERCVFKFAQDLEKLLYLLSNMCERGSGGKFITAYPADDEQFRRLAARLDAATDGLPGPVILSDRRLRPGSLVHYRYGAFGAAQVLNNIGSFESLLTAPDGSQVRDERQAWFSPPSWAELPFPQQNPAEGGDSGDAAQVLIGGRFRVSRAIRHSYRGGVFFAVDDETDADVVLKQARPHVMPTLQGTDARDLLRNEAEVLDLLGALGLAPRKIALVEHQGDLFLAQEFVPGLTLRKWINERAVGAWQGNGAPPAEAVSMAAQLAEIVAGVHAQKLVLRDLSPNNIVVTPQGRLRLIDLEYAVPAGSRATAASTPGYAAPGVVPGRFGPVPAQQADLFSLGACIVFLASGVDPLLPDDAPPQRGLSERLVAFVSGLGDHMPAVRRLAPVLSGVLQDDPDTRWSLTQVQQFLAAPDGTVPVKGGCPPAVPIDRLLAEGFGHVVRTLDPQESRLWPTRNADESDPCNVQFGAAGVLAVLTRAAEVLGDQHLRDGVTAVARWVGSRLYDIPRLLPGLYFGRSGTAWALHDAARFIGDDELACRAVELAKQVPLTFPCPDICHGVAGAGMAQLHLWRATGDQELRRRVVVAADNVLAAARERDGHAFWPIPETFGPPLAGKAHFGFGHGVAGAGAFLLSAGQATEREDYLEAAARAGATLEAAAEIDGEAAWWPVVPKDDDPKIVRARHWCKGAAGVGTFLIRLWSVTGENRFRELAEAAAAAVHRERWYSNTSACHGLSGHGDFLLDLAEFTGDDRYLDWAHELIAVMYSRHAIRDGSILLPDETGVRFTVGYNTGMSGALGFLLRLRHGGPRWWMVDDLDHVPRRVGPCPSQER